MKSAYFRVGKKFEVADCPEPEVGPDGVLVKIHYCGVCGSDIHLVEAGMLPPNCVIQESLVFTKWGGKATPSSSSAIWWKA